MSAASFPCALSASLRRAAAVAGLALALCAALAGPVAAETEPFRVALTGKFPPFSFYGGAEGELMGFDVDVSRAVGERLGRPTEIITTEWDGILAGLLSGRFDAIIGSMAITPERAERVDFSQPYYISGAQLFIHSDRAAGIAGIADLAGKRVGAVLGTTYAKYLEENHPRINAVSYKSDVDIFQDMLSGRLDGFVSDRLVGGYQIKEAEMPFVPAGHLLYDERIGIPVRKGSPALLAAINDALQAMESEGEFEWLHEKWFGLTLRGDDDPEVAKGGGAGGGALSQRAIVRKLATGFGLTLLIAFASIFIGFALAVPAGVILNGRFGPLTWLTRAVVDFLRGTPVLIQLFFVYYGLDLPAKGAAIFTLSINSAAYMAEVVRAGLMAVDSGQKEAGRALGLTPYQTFRFVVWPQAFRIALPPLMNSAVALLKDTALVSVITVAEVLHQAQSIIAVTFDPMRYYFIVALMFFVFTYPLMILAGRIERRLKQKGFKDA